MAELYKFYNSSKWKKLMTVIKQERTNVDGNIICEHCGKPILKAYDIIGHHKTELTEDNVSNAEISLNPNNIMLVHLSCHNDIHNKLDRNHRNVYLIYGSAMSGKTSYVEAIRKSGDLIVDIDNIWECISCCKRYTKPRKLKQIVFSVRDCLINDIKYRRGYWNNAYIIGGYPLQTERERIVNELGAKAIYIEATKEECLRRLYENPNGRDVEEWSCYIHSWFDMFTE